MEKLIMLAFLFISMLSSCAAEPVTGLSCGVTLMHQDDGEPVLTIRRFLPGINCDF